MINLDRNALVWGVVGNLGGGKTLSSVALGVEAMLNGYFVISNITFNIPRIENHYRASWLHKLYMHISLDDPNFDPFKLPVGSPRGSNGRKRVIVILDEVAEWFDQYAQVKSNPVVQRIWSWLRHSSKRSQDVVIICQRQEFINKVIRSLIARWIWVDDLAVYRLPYLKIKFPFCGNLVMQNVFDRLGNRISSVSFISKRFWGQFYNTAECLNSDGASYNSIYDMPERNYKLGSIRVLVFISSQFYLLYKLVTLARPPAGVPM